MLSGYEIPVLGFGASPQQPLPQTKTFASATKNPSQQTSTPSAATTGTFDSARAYDGEKACGEAIRAFGIPRDEVFVTSKFEGHGAGVYRFISESQTVRRAEGEKGHVKGFGGGQEGGQDSVHGGGRITGFIILWRRWRISRSLSGSWAKGMRLHPWLARRDIVEWCRRHGVVVEAYCPLAKGQRFDGPRVKGLWGQVWEGRSADSPAMEFAKGGFCILNFCMRRGVDWVCRALFRCQRAIWRRGLRRMRKCLIFELTEGDMAMLDVDSYAPTTWDPTVSPLNS
ncbi:hypothetical protein CCMA1212_009417 [Trichoderma ghanense]|uniref:NADP-dependent oxidoreductase domain-containing protein n=1 Tax=Trichoderma ghanense TaxID=65468 RepID=A0ABY2GUE2_9HYPO